MLRRNLVVLAAAATLIAGAGSAGARQDSIAGDWEGLIAGQLRVVFHLADEDGTLTGTMDSPDQGSFGLALDSVTFEEGALRLTLDVVGGVYEGTMQEDGSVHGTWSQSAAPQPYDLDLTRVAESG